MNSIGERLRIARNKRGLTQEALANLVQTPLTQGTIAHIENGRSETSRHIVWIAAALRVRAEWLVTGKGEMFESEWLWPEIPLKTVAELPEQTLEDIGDYIQMKLAKHAKNGDETK
jgi:transcriptional regulator with XRE-family HTH domain